MKIRFIGDIHGHFNQYLKIIQDQECSVQIGDHGIGFARVINGSAVYDCQPYQPRSGHRFIRGNHDNPSICKSHPSYIPDGTIENDIMYIGGALSIDRAWRIEGQSWWADEELSTEQLNELVDIYRIAKPRIMVTHECPESIANLIIVNNLGGVKINDPSRTRQAFESMIHFHKPQLHIFGHWHTSFDYSHEGTRYICLNELETIDVTIPDSQEEEIKVEWV